MKIYLIEVHKLKKIDLDETFPNFILENKKNFKMDLFKNGAPDRSRTHNLRSRNPALYPVEATGA